MNRPLDYQLDIPEWEAVRKHLVNKAIMPGDSIAGIKYPWFLETREALLDSGYLTLVAEMLWSKIKKYEPEVLFGRGFGATLLLISLQLQAEKENYPIKILMGREKRKDHNRQKLIEGPRVLDNARTVYIDDALNWGDSLRFAIAALKEEKYKLNIVAHACVFDFWRWRGSRRQEILGMPIERLYTRHDLGLTRIDPLVPVCKDIKWRNLANNQWYQWHKCPPKIVGDKVYFANDKHQIFVHDLSSGKILWKWQGPKPKQEKGIVGELQIFEDKLYVSSYDGCLYCLNLHTGEKIWSIKLDWFLHSTPFINIEKREIYIATEGGLSNKRGDIVGLDLDTAAVKWRVPTNHVVPASPYLFENQIICGSNDNWIYSVTDGILNWKTNIGTFKGRANSIDEVIIATADSGKIFGLDRDGKILWKHSCGRMVRHQFLPVHKGLGLVYILNEDGLVIAYDKHGNKIWMRQLRGTASWGLTLKDNELIAVTEAGYVAKLNPKTGEKIAVTKLGTRVHCPCDFNSEFIVFHTLSKGLMVYNRNI